jgi:hypothetical protein
MNIGRIAPRIIAQLIALISFSLLMAQPAALDAASAPPTKPNNLFSPALRTAL